MFRGGYSARIILGWGVLGSGVRGFVLLPGKSRVSFRVEARFFFFQGRMFFLQRQGKIKVIFRARSEQDSQGFFLSEVRQSKVVKILFFSGQGQGRV